MTSVSAPDKTAALQCKVITDVAEWQQLAGVWDSLLLASPDHTPWQGFDFLNAWWTHLGGKMPLRIVVVERNAVPCLIMPLQISEWTGIPGFPVRLLEPVSMIMDVNRPRLALGPFDPEAYRCALDAIWQRKREWDLIRLDEKPWEDPEVLLLRTFAQEHDCVLRQTFSHLVPYLDLRQTWPGFLQTKSQKMRKNLKAARKKLESIGPVELRSYRSNAAEIERGFDIFLDLHSRSWKQKRKVEHSKSPQQRAFFAQWLRTMAQRQSCCILVLFCNGEPAAATIAFTGGDVYYSAQIVHDAKFAACSPGTLLESLEFEQLMTERRYARYEFLGSFLNNKMRWSDTATHSSIVLMFRRSIRTFLMDAYYHALKPYLRPTFLKIVERLSRKKNATSPAQQAG